MGNLPWDVCERNTCRAWGDPHVDGFDGNRNDVYGGAIYSLSETTGPGFTYLICSEPEFWRNQFVRTKVLVRGFPLKIMLKMYLVYLHSKLQWRRANHVTWHLSKKLISLSHQIPVSQPTRLRSPSGVSHISRSTVVLISTLMLRSVPKLSLLISLERDQIRNILKLVIRIIQISVSQNRGIDWRLIHGLE